MPGQRRRSDFLVAAVLIASSALLLAQSPASQPPVFRSGVDIVVVEAHVVDQNGALARGLTPADFQVTLGGRTRSVVTAELVAPQHQRLGGPAYQGGRHLRSPDGPPARVPE
jgi:hypothetical protein